jgi:glycosyltransferase involved in cell wall biosynthesis
LLIVEELFSQSKKANFEAYFNIIQVYTDEMNILIADSGIIPAQKYGGTERVIWYLGKELAQMGHRVTFLVQKGSVCDFAKVLFYNSGRKLAEQIPVSTDIVHFNFVPEETIEKPHIITVHGNCNDFREYDLNSVFVSKNHAGRFGSDSFVYNGLDWDDYGKPDLDGRRDYFHFLGKAAWRVKNVQGAIDVIKATKNEELMVLGGHRLNLKMGFRFTASHRVHFFGMVGGAEKNLLLSKSKGLIFPVRWHEPFGLALIESLYFGCPVFGTPYGSLPEIVIPEVGFLSNSMTGLAGAIENAEQFSKAKCHQYAVEQFNSKKMAEAYLEKYSKVLNDEKLNLYPPQLIEKQTAKLLDWK